MNRIFATRSSGCGVLRQHRHAAAGTAHRHHRQASTVGHFPKDSVQCVPDGHGQYAAQWPQRQPGRTRGRAGPAGTKSYAVMMTDPDVPADFGSANKDGVTFAANAPRQRLYHWVLADIPANRTHLSPGDGNVFDEIFGEPHGNAQGEGPLFYEAGYGGPCPPWNDMRPHHYKIHRIRARRADASALTPAVRPARRSKRRSPGHVLARAKPRPAMPPTRHSGPDY